MPSRITRSAANALSRRVVRAYPRPWRDRYEAELLSLLDDSPARLRDVADLMRGLLVERARSLFEPGDRPLLTAVLVSAERLVRAAVVMAIPVLAGWAAHLWLGAAMPRAMATAAILVVISLWITVAVQSFRGVSAKAIAFEPWQPLFSSRRWRRVWFGLLLTATFLMSWSLQPNEMGLGILFWLYAIRMNEKSPLRSWQVVMAHALSDLRTSQHEMKWAQMELQRCERLIGKDSTAALESARKRLVGLARRREDALARLHSLGYRAMFQTRPAEP